MPPPPPEKRQASSAAPRGARVDAAGLAWRLLFSLVLLLLLWKVREAILMAFAGILFAVFVRGLARRVAHHTRLSDRWATAAVYAAIVLLLSLAVWQLGPQVSRELRALGETLPATVSRLEAQLRETRVGAFVLEQAAADDGGTGEGAGGSAQTLVSGLRGVASRLIGSLTGVVVVLFVGIYMSISPELYRKGLLLLVPEERRPRAREVLDQTGHTLWRWLVGKAVAMLFVGLAASAGLALLGVPMPYALGLIAGLLDFVPFVGPIVAAVPAVLLAFTEGPRLGAYTALLYLVIQQIEGNIVTPLVQRRQVQLAPALVILAEVVGGILFGIIGVILATPLAAALLVLTKMLYVEDVLDTPVRLPGDGED